MKRGEKAVIFSNFVTFLNLIEGELKSHGHKSLRIDGQSSIMDRMNTIEAFNNDNGPRFMLCSIQAAGVGINLARANHCFIMDPWWNEATESQAMDRVHRLGQTRPVRVVRFVMADSIEDRLVKVQRAKAALGKGSLEKLSAEEERQAKPTALKDLFEIAADEEDDMDDFIDWSG